MESVLFNLGNEEILTPAVLTAVLKSITALVNFIFPSIWILTYTKRSSKVMTVKS